MSSRRVFGAVLTAIGACLAVVAFYGIVLQSLFGQERYFHKRLFTVEFICSLVAAAIAPLLIVLGKRCLTIVATEAMVRDTRPPILLLHSFQDDGRTIKRDNNLVTWFTSFFTQYIDEGELVFEELLATHFAEFGPMIAIGQPEEKLPQLGAARKYVSEGEWQEEVIQLVQRSQLVVMIVGSTQGLLWEVRKMVELDMPEKLLLAFPPLETEELKRRWDRWLEQTEDVDALALPRQLPDNPLFATFSSNWKCHVVTGTSRTESEYQRVLPLIIADLKTQRRPLRIMQGVASLNPSSVSGSDQAPLLSVIRCPNCEKSFSVALDSCPVCGGPNLWKSPMGGRCAEGDAANSLLSESTQSTYHSSGVRREKPMNKRLVILGVGLLALAAASVLIWVWRSNQAKITKANFEKIADGMTIHEVEAILGQGTLVSEAEDNYWSNKQVPRGKVLKVVEWKRYDKVIADVSIIITIWFADDKVWDKLFIDLKDGDIRAK